MALTFGTLLSSQGADAHRHGPSRPIGGNPRYFTPVSEPRSNRPAPPGLPTWSPHTIGSPTAARRAWGNVRPAPLVPSGGSRWAPLCRTFVAPCAEQGEH